MRSLSAVVVAAGAALAISAAPLAAQRRVVQAVESDSLPRIRVEVDPAFGYLGRVDLDVAGAATAEQHLFAEVTAGVLGRMVIVHFERWNPGSANSFEYPRLRMDTLGGEEYLHQLWPLPAFDLFKRPELVAFLTAKGLRAGDDWLMSRWVRAVDPAKKHEIILFYLEPGDASPVPVRDLVRDGAQRARWTDIEKELDARSRRAFRVVRVR